MEHALQWAKADVEVSEAKQLQGEGTAKMT